MNGPGNGQVLFPPRNQARVHHDGVFIDTAYHYAMTLAVHRGQVVQDEYTGMLVMSPSPRGAGA